LLQVLDAQPLAEAGQYRLGLAPGNPADVVEAAVLKPINAKLEEACFLLTDASATRVRVRLAESCGETLRARLEAKPPAGLLASPLRGERDPAATRKPASI
jgi:hypothetical protein